MNARTSILPDFIVPDQELLNILDITDDLEIAENMFSYSLLEKNILLHRASEDKGRINKYGTKLLSKLCVTPPFSINFRCQIENQVSDYRLLGASSYK
jgi:hypothetical protein